MRVPLLVALSLLPFAFPTVAASTPACADVTELYPMIGSTYYVPNAVVKAVDLFRENNGEPGLQRSGCIKSDGSLANADPYEQTVGPGNRLCLGNLCLF